MDISLLKNIAQGDENALNQLYQLHKDFIYNTALSYLQNIEEAEEITQDVFIKVFQKANTFKEESKVTTWIYRITVNLSLNKIRSRKKFFSFDTKNTVPVEFNHPGVLLENKEKTETIFKAINKLAERQKTAFILSYIEELPRQEVADIMNCTLKSVESLLQRGKLKLRIFLDENEGN